MNAHRDASPKEAELPSEKNLPTRMVETMLNLKVPIGERVYLREREPGSERFIELGSLVVELPELGQKLEVSLNLPERIQVEREPVRAKRLELEQAARPNARPPKKPSRRGGRKNRRRSWD